MILGDMVKNVKAIHLSKITIAVDRDHSASTQYDFEDEEEEEDNDPNEMSGHTGSRL